MRINGLDTGMTDDDLAAVVPGGRTSSYFPKQKAARPSSILTPS
ncbi:MAG: hypothetical protein WDN48_18720 [Pseudolabrys sp.]